MKLSEAYKLYEMDKKILGFSDYTFKAYGIQLNLLTKYFGDKDVNDFTVTQLKEYISKDLERLKPSSVGHRIRFLRSIFRYFHEEGIINRNPTSKIREPKQGKRIPKFIPEIEMEQLWEACSTSREKALFSLLYSTGCRIGEIHRLNKNNVNWENRSIIVLGKGDKEREVYFNTKTYIWLKEYIDSRNDNEESLFVSERRPIKRSTIHQLRYTIKRIANHSNVDLNIYPHKLRHSFATHLLDRGASLEIISDLCGHQKIETTRIYAHLSGERRREQYRKYF